jgi:hypothetical protein
MAGRGPQTFHKRQKEQARKEKQQMKIAKRLERKLSPGEPEEENLQLGPFDPEPQDTDLDRGFPHDATA